MINQRFSLFIWVVAVLLVGGCNNGNPISKVNRANYDQIHEKMSKKEVQAILRPPASTSTETKLSTNARPGVTLRAINISI